MQRLEKRRKPKQEEPFYPSKVQDSSDMFSFEEADPEVSTGMNELVAGAGLM